MKDNKTEEKQTEEITAEHFLSLASLSPSAALTIVKLDLFQCNLDALPSSLPDICPQLKILFLMRNNFTEMPAVIGSMPDLEMVSFKSNALKKIHPDALQSQMRWLILTDNQLEYIPDTIGRCKRLQKFMLAGNKLKALPDTIGNCTNLELIRLSSNELVHPPLTLLSLPSLSWVALSDNPFLVNVMPNQQPVLKTYDIPGSIEDLGQILGQGASGVTYKYQDVAIKKYSSTITSDGNPVEEKRAAVAVSALRSKCFVNVLGETIYGSLVMELLRDVTVLADPPSMKTCSRDVYKNNLTFTIDQVLSFITQLLEALKSIHSIGLTHGDFYGHNILYQKGKDGSIIVKLTDFGAAFFYGKKSSYSDLIERIEMRAFGHLVEELFLLREEKCSQNYKSKVAVIKAIITECFSSSASRKSFEELSVMVESALNFE